MMYEEKLLSAMVNAQQIGGYSIGCYYAKSLCKFLSIDIEKIPNVSFMLTTESDKQLAYLNNYFTLLDLIAKTASDKIAKVRQKYNTKQEEIIH